VEIGALARRLGAECICVPRGEFTPIPPFVLNIGCVLLRRNPLIVTHGQLVWLRMYSAKGRFLLENLSSAVRLLPLLRVELGVGYAFEGAEAAFPDVPADRFGSVG
jgi:hypothetical protein